MIDFVPLTTSDAGTLTSTSLYVVISTIPLVVMLLVPKTTSDAGILTFASAKSVTL